MKRILTGVAAASCAVLAFSSVIVPANMLRNKPVPLGDSVMARCVAVLLDSSGTMARDFEAGKRVILEKILPDLSAGDEVPIYRIGTGFSEGTHVIVNGDLGRIPQRLLDPSVLERVPVEIIDGLRRRADTRIAHEAWVRKINSVVMEPPTGSSDYLAALHYMSTRCAAINAEGSAAPRQLIIVGDRQQDPAPGPFMPPEPTDDETDAFAGVQVTMVYPFRMTSGAEGESRAWDEFWVDYFSRRGADVRFRTFDDQQPLIASSVLGRGPSPERRE